MQNPPTAPHVARYQRSLWPFGLERQTGIEPAFSAWKADALPLSYCRIMPVFPGCHVCLDCPTQMIRSSTGVMSS